MTGLTPDGAPLASRPNEGHHRSARAHVSRSSSGRMLVSDPRPHPRRAAWSGRTAKDLRPRSWSLRNPSRVAPSPPPWGVAHAHGLLRTGPRSPAHGAPARPHEARSCRV